ncbi:hypothetical protein GCM10007972_19020 [Iodidimonas muriae]|uniref:Uncharacterized protein n=1 Tax=Iodidimonas muriae TaxID=261467 RepID=A0ABQ2LG23_9PROT|nr:hypothetical protein [Iodidimonas muriae]GER07067.1 hypothetical protein JCM17843_13770 [Kordiimonadales bacterium JCM 17843]GGO13133.1 hypothetical protein GCM10007972_19020 [Iodidimonas muriae]
MSIRIILSLLMLLAGGGARGTVFIPEAAIKTGYGPTSEAWSTHWSGACAERVGIEIGYTGHSEIQNMLPRVTDYVRGAVPHVLSQCPQANIIQVNVPGRPANPRPVYQFEMHRNAGWVAQNALWYSDLVRDTLAQGYLPAEMGYHNGLVRFQDGRFEAIYGKMLRSHLVGTDIERHMQEGTSPPRVSHHTISGHWYELGSERPNGQCTASRDGYALWGSFTMVINRGHSNVQMIRKFCAEAGEKGHSDELYLSPPSPSGFKRLWGIEWVKFTDSLHKQLADLDLDTADDLQTFIRTRKALYKSQKLTLYPAQDNWCMNRRMDAYYTVPSEDRNQAFGGNYAKALGERARQVVNEYCGDALTASVSNYREGDETPWDRMSFQFRPIQASAFGNDKGYLKLLDQHLSERAQAHLEYLNANHLGPACSDAPFCELPGGRYLNAIYNGRGDLVQEMDQLQRAEVNEMLSRQMAQVNMTENPITQLLSGMIEADDGLIVGAANKYMYAYAAWGAQCLKSGAKTRTFVHTTSGTETINFDGSTDYEPGQTYEAEYTINPEFFPLLERVGSHYGAQDSTSPLLNKAQRLVLQGLVQMKNNYDCTSPEVARFERNLIALAEDDLNGQPLRVLSVPAVGVTKQVQPTQTASPAQSTEVPVQQVPDEARQAAPMAAPAKSSTSTLSTAERYAKMNAEIKTLSDAFLAEINVMNVNFQADMQKAGTDAKRLEMLREFNNETARIRTKLERETQAIKDKYKD